MAKQADALMRSLRELLLAALAEADAPGKVANPVVDALLKDHRTDFWGLIENYSSEQWMIGKYDGHAEGVKAVRANLLDKAGAAFAARRDDEANALRKMALALDTEVTAAEARAKQARKERGR